jgi:O-antigen ligase
MVQSTFSKQHVSKFKKRWDKLFFGLTFLMAFPAILIVQNLSFYFFVLLLFHKVKFGREKMSYDKLLFWLGLLFSYGAILSTINTPLVEGKENMARAISAMPNYVYWGFLIAFLVNSREYINMSLVHKAIFYGVLCYIPYFYLREAFSINIPVLQRTSNNNYAFLMICFSPTALYYCSYTYGKKVAILLWIGILASLLFLGRRAGFTLVGLTGSGVLFFNRVNIKTLVTGIVTIVTIAILLSTPFIEDTIHDANERIYGLIYERDKVQTEDRSYLTRMAMVEKGLNLFERYPYTGVGLSNFSQIEGAVEGDFDGSQFVINKQDLNTLSAHNSYISILSEGGLFLFVPFILILFTIILYFIFNFNTINVDNKPLYWSIIGMTFHYYYISAVVNVYGWFVIALCAALKYRKQ